MGQTGFFALKETVSLYRQLICIHVFIGASEAFDRVNHTKRTMKTKNRVYYQITDLLVNPSEKDGRGGGVVRQGGTLSPLLFNSYIYEPSKA